ncbi:acetoacetate decarboxylase [Roseomonas sp. CCTCC AB2023176]|uniref:acetoacetate decarboxylase n=1 Tax=Roseomonas sp. CCTCC AB2023176 TaxID=3342640 RepID=UPI0035D5B6A6
MRAAEVRAGAFAMPRTSPSYPVGPYAYARREYLTVTYRTDPEAAAAVIPAPLRPGPPEVRFQFVRVPDSTGFGDYAMALQILPVLTPEGQEAGYVHGSYVNSHTANAAGRELWGFPHKLAAPSLAVERDTLVGTLSFGPVPVARATMGFKHRALKEEAALAELQAPGVLLKIIPHVDGKPRICELVRFRMSGVRFHGGWSGPAALDLLPHGLAPVAELPVRGVLSATHLLADCVLEHGSVIHDYLRGRGA